MNSETPPVAAEPATEQTTPPQGLGHNALTPGILALQDGPSFDLDGAMQDKKATSKKNLEICVKAENDAANGKADLKFHAS